MDNLVNDSSCVQELFYITFLLITDLNQQNLYQNKNVTWTRKTTVSSNIKQLISGAEVWSLADVLCLGRALLPVFTLVIPLWFYLGVNNLYHLE